MKNLFHTKRLLQFFSLGALALASSACFWTTYGYSPYQFSNNCYWDTMYDNYGSYQQQVCWNPYYGRYMPYYVGNTYVRNYPVSYPMQYRNYYTAPVAVPVYGGAPVIHPGAPVARPVGYPVATPVNSRPGLPIAQPVRTPVAQPVTGGPVARPVRPMPFRKAVTVELPKAVANDVVLDAPLEQALAQNAAAVTTQSTRSQDKIFVEAVVAGESEQKVNEAISQLSSSAHIENGAMVLRNHSTTGVVIERIDIMK